MRRRWLAASLPALALLFVSAWSLAEHTSSSRYVPYQGQLQNGGAAVDDTVEMTFSFYDVPAGGSALDTVTLDVEVHAGAFAVDIGPVAETVFNASPLYLGVTVNGVVLPERQTIRAVPYAMHGQVGEAFTADEVVAGVVTAASLDVSGNATLNNVHVGEMGYGANWAGLRHASVGSADRYALLQNATGSETLINAASGGSIGFRFGNVPVASLDDDGDLEVSRVITGDGTIIGGMTVSSEYAAYATMAGGVSVWSASSATLMTPSATSFCALVGEGVSYNSATPVEPAVFSEDCDISVDGEGRWVLTASASRAYHGHPLTLECRARCLSWD